MALYVVFTDLDGTLLDQNYSFSKAKDALEVLRKIGALLVPISSKSYMETVTWSSRIGSIEVFSYEGGFGIGVKKNSQFLGSIKKVAEDFGYIPKEVEPNVLFELDSEKVDKKIKGFFYRFDLHPKLISKMSIQEIVRITGLTKEDAILAKERRGPSPFLIRKNTKEIIKRFAEKSGLFASLGKHFMILAPYHKGMAVRVIKKAIKRVRQDVTTLGFGDSPADKFLLEEVDHPFWVSGPEELNRKILEFFKEVENG